MSDEKQEERTTGVTIRELKAFLARLPEEFDDFGLVNGEVAGVDDYYVRIDKAIVHIEIDEGTKELLLLNQTEEELESIMKEIDGTTERVKK